MLIFAMGSWLKLVKYAVKGGIKEQSSRTGVRERRENQEGKKTDVRV